MNTEQWTALIYEELPGEAAQEYFVKWHFQAPPGSGKVRRRSGARCPLINIQVGARPAARTDSPPGVTQTYQGKVPLCSSRCSCLQTTPLPVLGKTGPRKQSLQPIMLDLLVSREGFQHQKQPHLCMNAASNRSYEITYFVGRLEHWAGSWNIPTDNGVHQKGFSVLSELPG